MVPAPCFSEENVIKYGDRCTENDNENKNFMRRNSWLKCI